MGGPACPSFVIGLRTVLGQDDPVACKGVDVPGESVCLTYSLPFITHRVM
jgi:hypothetical protein